MNNYSFSTIAGQKSDRSLDFWWARLILNGAGGQISPLCRFLFVGTYLSRYFSHYALTRPLDTIDKYWIETA